MVEASPHEACSGVSSGCVGNIEIPGSLMEQFVFVDCASGVETEKV
jgi:hypothetical protein